MSKKEAGAAITSLICALLFIGCSDTGGSNASVARSVVQAIADNDSAALQGTMAPGDTYQIQQYQVDNLQGCDVGGAKVTAKTSFHEVLFPDLCGTDGRTRYCAVYLLETANSSYWNSQKGLDCA